MRKNGKNKVSKIIISIWMTCLLIAGSVMQVGASDTTDLNSADTMTQKCAGVFTVNLVYVDGQNEAHVVKSGNGFLTGNGEDVSYVITSRDTIAVGEETRTQVIQEFGLEQEAEISLIPRLVIKGDVVMDAEVIVSSEEMGFAVLKLQQPVHGREALCFAPNPENTKAMDTVFSLWSPDGVVEGEIFKWLEEGEISMLWHNAILSGQGTGGPLLDEQGNVVAINTQLLETGYMQAVDVTEVTAVLEIFGVPYTMAEEVEVSPIVEQAQAAQNTNETTEESIDEAQLEALLSQETEETTVAEEYMIVTEPSTLPIGFWIGIGVVVLMIIGIIILLCKIIAGDRKKEKQLPKQKEQFAEPTPSCVSYQQPVVFSDETTVLGMHSGMDMDATTILSNRMGMDEYKGYLVKEKDGERIFLSKSLFIIGTDGLRVDYCIKDNKSVSRVHAQIRQINGEYTLENLRPTNGTYLNGVKLQDVETKPLHPGDCVSLANERFIFNL